MKLYATIKPARGGKEARKGDDNELTIELTHKGAPIGLLEVRAIGANGWSIDLWRDGRRHRETNITDKGELRKGNGGLIDPIGCENHAYYRHDCLACRKVNDIE